MKKKKINKKNYKNIMYHKKWGKCLYTETELKFEVLVLLKEKVN